MTDVRDMQTERGNRIVKQQTSTPNPVQRAFARLSRVRVIVSVALLAVAAIAAASIVGARPADAQIADPAKSAPKAAAKTPAAPVAAATPGDSGLKARVESLEEQLVDMQVVVGTLESMSKSGSASSQPAFRATSSGGADAGRVEALDAQVKSLTSQVQQLTEQVRSMGGVPRRSDAAAAASVAAAPAASPPTSTSSAAFGSTTVSPDGDAIGGLIGADSGPVPGTGALGATPAPVATAALPPASEGGDPKQQYETAYGYLLQRDYGAAETAFDDFLKKYPTDSLAGNAQYWLGESHFVRGQYKAAASAFLKGYQTYAQGAKAPDSLLKLAMSLDRLGQKEAACSSFSELNTKFPNAGQNVKARAQSERQRVGCT